MIDVLNQFLLKSRRQGKFLQTISPVITSPITLPMKGKKRLNNNSHSLQENQIDRLNFERPSAEIDSNELPREMPASIKRGDARGELLDSRFLSAALYYQIDSLLNNTGKAIDSAILSVIVCRQSSR